MNLFYFFLNHTFLLVSDVVADQRAGLVTTAMRLGASGSYYFHCILMLVTYGTIAATIFLPILSTTRNVDSIGAEEASSDQVSFIFCLVHFSQFSFLLFLSPFSKFFQNVFLLCILSPSLIFHLLSSSFFFFLSIDRRDWIFVIFFLLAS